MPLLRSHRPDPVAPAVNDPAADPPRQRSLFSRRRSLDAPARNPNDDVAPARRGFFGGRQSASPADERAAAAANANNGSTRRGFFGGARGGSLDGEPDAGLGRNGSVRSGNSSVRSGGLFSGRGHFDVHKDPTIVAAREKVSFAERAEIEADRALEAARGRVREARDHVKFLEREAAEEAKRAKAKQAVTNDVSRSAAGLGRHGN